jgi:hypothetical protein
MASPADPDVDTLLAPAAEPGMPVGIGEARLQESRGDLDASMAAHRAAVRLDDRRRGGSTAFSPPASIVISGRGLDQ